MSNQRLFEEVVARNKALDELKKTNIEILSDKLGKCEVELVDYHNDPIPVVLRMLRNKKVYFICFSRWSNDSCTLMYYNERKKTDVLVDVQHRFIKFKE